MSTPSNELSTRRIASLGALSAAIAVTAGTQDASAAIVLTNVNQSIGFAPGDSAVLFFPTGAVSFGVATSTFFGFSRSIVVGATAAVTFSIKQSGIFAAPLNAGVQFTTSPLLADGFAYVQYVSSSGSTAGPGVFTDKYYSFSFVDTDSVTKYGWILGSLTDTTYDGLSYTLKSYAYEDTGVSIATGQTTLVPEPTSATALLGAAMIAGSRGVRRWKQAKAAA